jgi:protein-disulfide isomerase
MTKYSKPGDKTQSSKQRSIWKPTLLVAALILVAVSAAYFLSRRDGVHNSAAASNQDSATGINSKPVITTEGWSKGNPSAKTVLVEFGDFQCPSCAMARLKVENVLKKFEKDLKVVFKEYPMEQIHKNSMIAAQAAEAAGRQMKFWEMYEALFSKQSEWAGVPDAATFFLKYAADLQLDLEKFKRDLLDGDLRNKIFRDMLEGQVAQVRSVPTFFINGKMIQSVKSDAEFEDIISQAIRTPK